MGSLEGQLWELFLRKVISRTLGMFRGGSERGEEQSKLWEWNTAQVQQQQLLFFNSKTYRTGRLIYTLPFKILTSPISAIFPIPSFSEPIILLGVEWRISRIKICPSCTRNHIFKLPQCWTKSVRAQLLRLKLLQVTMWSTFRFLLIWLQSAGSFCVSFH